MGFRLMKTVPHRMWDEGVVEFWHPEWGAIIKVPVANRQTLDVDSVYFRACDD